MSPFRMALEDMRNDAVFFVCAAALVAAVVGPFLILLSVKAGVVSGLLDNLRDTPRAREIRVFGDHRFDAERIAEIARWPEVGFVTPQTAAMVSGRISLRAVDGRVFVSGASAPTGPNDPLRNDAATLAPDEVALSHGYAEALGVRVGDRVELDLERGRPNPGFITPAFTVRVVLRPSVERGYLALFTAETADAIEAYGHGYAVPAFDVAEGRPLADRVVVWEKTRLYAKRIEDVGALEARFEARFRIDVETDADVIRRILQLAANLNAVLGFLSAASAIGLFCALAALFWSAQQRKRPIISMLSLMGAEPRRIAAIPVAQSLLVVAVGFAGALVIHAAAEGAVNAWFADALEPGRSVSLLRIEDGLLTFVGLAGVGMSSAAIAGFAAMRTDPALVMRKG